MGDDLTVTNIKRIKKAADEGACNALLLKVKPPFFASVSSTALPTFASLFLPRPAHVHVVDVDVDVDVDDKNGHQAVAHVSS